MISSKPDKCESPERNDSSDGGESGNNESDSEEENLDFRYILRLRRTASEMLYQKNLRLKKSSKKEKFREMWIELPDEKKFKYIDETYAYFIDQSWTEKKILYGLSKLEWKIFLRYATKVDKPPAMPPKTAYALYPLEEEMSGNRGVLSIQKKRFFELNYDEQKEILKKYIDLWETYVADFEKWKESADSLLVQAFYKSHSIKERRRAMYTKAGFDEVEINFVDGFYPPLKELPPFPPLNHHQLYAECIGDSASLLSHIPPGVHAIVKNFLRDVVEGMVDKYGQLLSNFVDELSPPNKRLFLGTKRNYFYNIFRRDLFESRFPNKYYPVYIKAPVNFFEKRSLDDDLPTSDFDALKVVQDSIAELRSFIGNCPSQSDTN